MNTKNFFKTAFVSAAITVIIGFNFTSNINAQTKDEKAVIEVLKLNAAAIEKSDFETLDKIWSNSEDVIVLEGGNADYTWVKYRDKHLAPELRDFKDLKYAVSDIKVKVDKKTAWATYKYTLAADYKTRKIETGGVGTMIFEKKGKNWIIVHSHTSAGY